MPTAFEERHTRAMDGAILRQFGATITYAGTAIEAVINRQPLADTGTGATRDYVIEISVSSSDVPAPKLGDAVQLPRKWADGANVNRRVTRIMEQSGGVYRLLVG